MAKQRLLTFGVAQVDGNEKGIIPLFHYPISAKTALFLKVLTRHFALTESFLRVGRVLFEL